MLSNPDVRSSNMDLQSCHYSTLTLVLLKEGMSVYHLLFVMLLLRWEFYVKINI